MGYLFSGKIKCLNCLQNYRGKMQRGKPVYICSGYHNKKSNCKRFLIREEDLIEMVNKRISIQNRYGIFFANDPLGYVSVIEVNGEEGKYVINYVDSKEYSITSKNHIKY